MYISSHREGQGRGRTDGDIQTRDFESQLELIPSAPAVEIFPQNQKYNEAIRKEDVPSSFRTEG